MVQVEVVVGRGSGKTNYIYQKLTVNERKMYPLFQQSGSFSRLLPSRREGVIIFPNP